MKYLSFTLVLMLCIFHFVPPNHQLMFGVNLDHAAQEGAIISVGDTVRVLSAQDKFFH